MLHGYFSSSDKMDPLEVFVEGYGSYQLWDDCAFCFVQGKAGIGSCVHRFRAVSFVLILM